MSPPLQIPLGWRLHDDMGQPITTSNNHTTRVRPYLLFHEHFPLSIRGWLVDNKMKINTIMSLFPTTLIAPKDGYVYYSLVPKLYRVIQPGNEVKCIESLGT